MFFAECHQSTWHQDVGGLIGPEAEECKALGRICQDLI